METLNRLPWAAQSAVFKKLESIADVGGMTRAERLQYDEVCRKIIKNIFFARCERKWHAISIILQHIIIWKSKVKMHIWH